MDATKHTLLIANRGEIAARIIRTAKRLGVRTVAVYTEIDKVAPYLKQADVAVNVDNYINVQSIVDACKQHGATLVHPGYGFLSENPEFASKIEQEGIAFLGPQSDIISLMGLKDNARQAAEKAKVPIVPGTHVLKDLQDAIDQANKIGFPVMLKASAGGGGIGLNICENEDTLRNIFDTTKQRCKSLFHNDDLFLEKYISKSRHIEVQVFGDGLGHAIHIGERECSVQRRHQKVIEESPSPFMLRNPDIRDHICKSAVDLAKLLKYRSAGTIEFLVDDDTGSFFFLEMNTRLQVEHPVTEEVQPGLDLVELMIKQGIAQKQGKAISTEILNQEKFQKPQKNLHSIQARVYCENPIANFRPAPGFFQNVKWTDNKDIRIETWIETGSVVSPEYDPLVAKVISVGSSRNDAIDKLKEALKTSALQGPITNKEYLIEILKSNTFVEGNAMTTFLNTFEFSPRAIEVMSGGLNTTVQDFPGRVIGFGIPVSGPMDVMSFKAANILCSNNPNTEALEITVAGPKLKFHTAATIAVTGAPTTMKLNGKEVDMWKTLKVNAGDVLAIGVASKGGIRSYLAVKGGFPEIATYLGSKSTFNSLGGYQGRQLVTGDLLALAESAVSRSKPASLKQPQYPDEWIVYCTNGPHDGDDFMSTEGRKQLYETKWTISQSSNRMGIRLEGPKLKFSRESGGQGGSHPSNIHDYGYAPGAFNINGDTPVLLTNDGPSMGGYITALTILTCDQWKTGQFKPGNTVQFVPLDESDAKKLEQHYDSWLQTLGDADSKLDLLGFKPKEPKEINSILKRIEEDNSSGRPQVLFRNSGDRHILVEYGPQLLDLNNRARAHLLETKVMDKKVNGITRFFPCVRSTLVRFEPSKISKDKVLQILYEAEGEIPVDIRHLTLPSRIVRMPIVLDDKWTAECLERYMRTIRSKAVYLPSNIEYLAKNNNISSKQKALDLLVQSNWLLVGIGFYLACPFLVPIDPRCRLVGSKMNPSRTYTPEGAVGIAGLTTAIYPVESPGGYSLFGRTLPAWSTTGSGVNFSPEKPWLFEQFDQIKFEPVSEDEYIKLLSEFKSGSYEFKIEKGSFSLEEYNKFIDSIQDEIEEFERLKAEGVAREEAREAILLREWEEEKEKQLREEQSQVKSGSGAENSRDNGIFSNMNGKVFKIMVKEGDVIKDAEQTVVILEAMKTEVNVEAGDNAVGKTVKRIVASPQSSVNAEDPLIYLK